MPYISQPALDRIHELEQALERERRQQKQDLAALRSEHARELHTERSRAERTWIPRVEALEKQIAEERAGRTSDLAEHVRATRWMTNMLLRRGETFPVPPKDKDAASEKGGVHAPRPLSPIVLSQYDAIRQAVAQSGRAMNDPEVVKWVKDETGHTPSEIEQKLQAQLSSELEQ